MHNPLTWDEWCTSFIRRAGFLLLAWLINHGLPLMDVVVLTALVDRWHPETHMFHLSSSETTVMMQDVAMILDLPIDDTPICGMVSLAGWRDSIGQTIGLQPPTSPRIRRIGRRHVCTPGGSQLTSIPARRALRTQSFKGLFGLVFDICMTSEILLT
jgi:hypothetical protein